MKRQVITLSGRLGYTTLIFFPEEILISQDKDPKFVKLKEQAHEGKAEGFVVHEDRGFRFKGRCCMPIGEPTLKERILDVAHNSEFFVCPGGDKIYQDLKLMFLWLWMMKDIAE